MQSRSTLLIDADDTLWENNIYFLDVTERFLDEVERHRVDREEARELLSSTERRNIPIHGYGSRAFALSMLEAYETLVAGGDGDTRERLKMAAHAIFERDTVEILPGVVDALHHMRLHHRLILVTKGDREEQERKLERSGLREFFEAIEVVPEKNEAAYRTLVAKYQLEPTSTWMIGNSPKSDINPALSAGLNAVFVPHRSTWELEIEAVSEDAERLAVVDSFGDLVALFVLPDE